MMERLHSKPHCEAEFRFPSSGLRLLWHRRRGDRCRRGWLSSAERRHPLHRHGGLKEDVITVYMSYHYNGVQGSWDIHYCIH
ncbi:unnamed protein product, partial [Staurois parvus]